LVASTIHSFPQYYPFNLYDFLEFNEVPDSFILFLRTIYRTSFCSEFSHEVKFRMIFFFGPPCQHYTYYGRYSSNFKSTTSLSICSSIFEC
jgi:hypothetical protein